MLTLYQYKQKKTEKIHNTSFRVDIKLTVNSMSDLLKMFYCVKELIALTDCWVHCAANSDKTMISDLAQNFVYNKLYIR